MQDALMLLRDGTTALTANEAAGTAVKLGSTPPGTPFFLHVSMPVTGPDADETAVFVLSGCHTVGGTYVAVVTTPAVHAKGVYDYGFVSDYEFYKLAATVAGTTPALGAVVVEVTPYARGPHDMPNV